MPRLNSPSLASYRSAIQSFISSPGPSLFTQRSDPPQNIFPLSSDKPVDLNTGAKNEDVIVRQPNLDHNGNIRAIGFLILHRCFFIPGMRPLSQLLDLVLSENFKIQFPPLGFETDASLFNDTQFKKLIFQFLHLIDSNEFSIQQGINRYPILDIILIHVIRTIANQHQQYDYSSRIPTERLLKFVHQAFGLRVIAQEGDEYYKFQNNYELIDGDKIYIIYPREDILENSIMKVSKVNSDNTFINVIGDIKDSVMIQQSHVFPVLRDIQKDFGLSSDNPVSNLTRLLNNDYGKVTSSQVFTSRLQKSAHQPYMQNSTRHPFERQRQQPVYRSNMFFEEKVGHGFRPSSFSTHKQTFRGDVKDELRKSQMRVSVMKNNSDIKNKRVSTAQIYNNDDYFGGTSKSQLLANANIDNRKPTIFSSGVSPFEQILKQNIQSERNTSSSFAHYNKPSENLHRTSIQSTFHPELNRSNKQPFEISVPITSNTLTHLSTKNSSITIPNNYCSTVSSHSIPQITSSYNVSDDGKTNVIKVQINQTVSNGGSLQSYYGDFTGSHVLDFLPNHNRSSIQGIKNSLKIQKNY